MSHTWMDARTTDCWWWASSLCSFEGRISLYCLALQEIQQNCFQLHEDKCLVSSLIPYNIDMNYLSCIYSNYLKKNIYKTFLPQQIFLQVLKMFFNCQFPKNNVADFSNNLLHMQEKVQLFLSCFLSIINLFVISLDEQLRVLKSCSHVLR